MNNLSPMLDITEYFLPLDISEVFGNQRESVLEIGFGEGEFLTEIAEMNEKRNFVGIEIKGKRFKKALEKAEKKRLTNLKLLIMDAQIAIEEVFLPNAFSEVYINFPDPWPKERHKKHRAINPLFLRKLSAIMKPDGYLEIASDHEEYVSSILDAVSETEIFKDELPQPGYADKIPNRPMTKYEKEFREEAREIFYLRFRKSGNQNL